MDTGSVRTINNEKEIIFTIGRMNPPTSGHVALIELLMNTAIQKGLTQINIILSSTTDSEKNPLECEEKRMLLYSGIIDTIKQKLSKEFVDIAHKINAMNVEIICMNDDTSMDFESNPILKSVEYILSLYGYPREGLKMDLIIGQDRKDSYGFIGTFLSQKSPPVAFDDSIILQRSEGAMSATYIRGLATSGTSENKQSFLEHYASIGIPAERAEEIYQQIRDNINPEPKPKKARDSGSGGSRKLRRKRIRKTIRKHKRKTYKKRRATKRRRA